MEKILECFDQKPLTSVFSLNSFSAFQTGAGETGLWKNDTLHF